MDSSGNIVIQRLDKADFLMQLVAKNVKMVNFTFPNVRPGSVVEFSYTRIEKDIIQIEPWIIQSEIPTVYSSVIITTPVSSQLKEKLYGSDSAEKRTELLKSDQFRRITYYKENIASFKPEPYMSSEKDNLMKMIFIHFPNSNSFLNSLSSPQTVWKFAGSTLLRSQFFGGQINKIIPGTEKIIDSAISMSSVADKIRFLYNSVKKRIPEKEEQTLYPEDITGAWANRSGNTAEINLILLNLLQKAKIRSFPLLISTRTNGIISKDFPSFGQLNGIDVVAIIDSAKYFIMDASEKFQSLENPPLNILNREVLLLNPENIDWFTINDERPLLKQNITLFCVMKENGIIEGSATLQHYNYAKSYMLDSTADNDETKEEKFFDKKISGLKIISANIENADKDEEPLFETLTFTYEPQKTDNFYFIPPQFLSPQKTNPFIADVRNTDIDLMCNQQIILSINLAISDSFEVENLPKNITLRAPDSSFYFKRSSSSTSENIYITQIFEIRQAIFLKEDYPGVKEFFSRLYTLLADEIILKKKI
jgi:hypothetical protein